MKLIPPPLNRDGNGTCDCSRCFDNKYNHKSLVGFMNMIIREHNKLQKELNKLKKDIHG